MRTLIIALFLSFVVSLVVTRLVRDLAIRRKWYDAAVGGRKLHTMPKPRLGGVGVAVAFAVPLLGLSLWRNDVSRMFISDLPLLISLTGGGLLMLGVGLWDDLKGTKPLLKLGAQVLAAVIVFEAGIDIEAMRLPFGFIVRFGWMSLPVTVAWIVLVTNAVNLIDGLDGLAGGVVALAAGTLLVMSVIEGNGVAAVLLASLLGATLGFLVLNMNPASIFLGDSGSLTLGFLLALISIHGSQKSTALFTLGAAVLIMGLPIFDLSLAVTRRALTGRSLFSADQHHIHHQLLRKGLSQRQTFLFLAGAAMVLEAGALLVIYADDRVQALVLLALVGLGYGAFRFLGYEDLIRSGRRVSIATDMERAAAARAIGVRELRDRAISAGSAEALWDVVLDFADQVDLQTAELVLGDGMRFAWDRTSARERRAVHLQGVVTRTFPIGLGAGTRGSLTVTRFREHEVFGPHDDAMCQALADAIALRMHDLHPAQEGDGAGEVSAS